MLRAKPCKLCGSGWHTKMSCPQQEKRGLTARRPLKRLGKVGKQWISTRKQWFAENPAMFYTCYICGRPMTAQETTLDHVKSRGRHPELRNELSNLKPCCWPCNTAKGSKDN